jgi:hypothetical protein
MYPVRNHERKDEEHDMLGRIMNDNRIGYGVIRTSASYF